MIDESSDQRLLRDAIALSRIARPSTSAYSVGAIIAAQDGLMIADGYSRERGSQSHAEQVAIEKALEAGADLRGSTLYTSLEPCSVRGSGLLPCAARIIDAGIPRVVFALREPRVFVEGHGTEVLAAAGVEVIEMSSEAPAVAQINAHLIG
ncbi:MAG TPA: deaminase [Verrucomicrobiae bacterium]|nr:deaminase [Verrucomicrobiae bacterium]